MNSSLDDETPSEYGHNADALGWEDDKHHTQFYRVQSLKSYKVRPAIFHNKREIQAELDGRHGIDPSRVHLNYALHGENNALDLFFEHTQITSEASKSARKDAVELVEIIVSLPAKAGIDPKAYFVDVYEWLKSELVKKGGILLSFDVHMDEANPHMHALVIPLIDGRLQGNKWKGGRGELDRMKRSLFLTVSVKHDIKMPKLTSADKQIIINAVRQTLTHSQDPTVNGITLSPLWDIIRDEINKNPIPYAEALSINVAELVPLRPKKQKKIKIFVDYARSPGKGSFIK